MRMKELSLFIKDIKELWQKYQLLSVLSKKNSIYISYSLGRFVYFEDSKKKYSIRIDGKIKEYFDGFDDDFFDDEVAFRGHNLLFIIDLLSRNMNNFDIIKK
ncbi:hypothetical protein RN81_03320 [Streptococcus anginosus]|uniref:hypothetical protein n=1 Tax=Streptococcus anginosus group TaxID=671232 RepID=UPI0006613D23|nr:MULTISPECIES: hypothetical protein [Streptococcus anginosus group]KUM01028.1 hypothetical protein RN81_03320 [Streptococcus anginosus]